MRNSIYSILSIAIFSLAFSYKPASISIQEPSDYIIGYINPETKQFQKISEEQLYNWWKNTLKLPKETSLIPPKLKRIKESKDDYIIYSGTKDGKIKIASRVKVKNKGKAMRLTLAGGETCKCISNCTWSGCEVIGMCLCTACEEGCTKEHIKTAEMSPRLFKSKS